MYIQSVDINGFKSYAQQVSLTAFDKSFNAITGLNGSGKSNILDAICFVLGIKNLSQVRATNLQELVYKQGQAGISKATVSITFHNDDPESGPSGYEDKEYITITRQIVIGGRNKYLINGHAAQENRITDLFHSVQLNVNNPHFLIMQGCITKVLNMKPPEILSLLEEAAGTRMYEKKKDAAMKTLDKKQSRLDQIDSVLQGDIVPSLEVLRQQCGQYNEWAKLSSRAEQLKRIIVAYDFCECLKQSDKVNQDVAGMKQKLDAIQAERASNQADLEDVEGLVSALMTEMELQAGGETKELQAHVDKLAMELTRGTTTWKSKCDIVAGEQAGLDGLQASLQELLEQDHEAKVAKSHEARTAARAALETAEAGVSAAQREVAGAEAGDGRDESNRSLQERLADAQTEATHADSEAKAADVRAKHLAKQLADQQKALSNKQSDAGTLQKDLAHQQSVVDKSTKKLQSLAFDEAACAALEEARETQGLEVRQAREAVDRLSQDVAGWCDFRYSPPDASFDKRRVHGVLARLVQVKDPATTLALEVAAGSRLYQVVVDDAKTAQTLLEKGRLTQRVTIIPLDKVYAPNLPGHVVNAAERMGGGKAKPALELVGSSDQLQAALKYAFGTSLVCEDAATARRLAFSREVSTRCVTLDGDDFNPSGLLTGGSRPGGRCVLATLHELAAAEGRLEAACTQLASIEAQLAGTAKAQAEHNKLRQEVALATHSLALLQERMACSESAQLAASVAALSSELAESKEAAEAARAKSKEVAALSKTLEREIANFGKEQGARLQAAKDKLKAAKAEVEKCRKALKSAEQQVAVANAERDAVGEEKTELQSKIDAAKKTLASLQAEEAVLRESTASSRVAYEDVLAQLDTRKKRMQESDNEIQGHRQTQTRLRGDVQKLEVEAHKLEKKMRLLAEHGQKCTDFAARVEKDYSWVAVEKAGFGSGDYNFANYDMRKCKEDYKQAEGRCAELKGKVNSKALDKLEKAETEFNGLMSKRQIVDKDRQCILEVINDLDDKKKLAMKDVWHKVNGFFSSIFATLLPGAQAKLVPPEGQSFLEGLEVKVAFGGVWKESLTELSGGQRSLLALSLLLGLCRYQPAPLYILDEVDAALDLNHTQNIGNMIKAHFPQSQFIVVSLKEGMFNNANVIFRTKFVDGVSAVTRTVTQRGRAEQQQLQQKSRLDSAAAGASRREGRKVLGEAN